MPMTTLTTLIRQALTRWHLRRSVGPLLLRADDHLLDDIGLTRHQAERLIATAPLGGSHDAALRMQSAAGVLVRAA